MANSLSALADKLLAQGLLALRENTVMPGLVNRQYEALAGQKGTTIDVPIPDPIAVQDVVAAATPPATADIAPTSVAIPLDKWKEAPFHLSDKEKMEVVNDIFPMQASEAIKSLANQVDQDLLDLHADIFGYVGSAGVTPFGSSIDDATQVRKTLLTQLAPPNDWRMVIDPSAEANALNLRAFHDMSFSGDAAAIIDGNLNRKLGFTWFMDQNVRTHVAGTGSGATTDSAGYAIGVNTITLASAGTGTILVGDIFTIAGDLQTYVVVTGDSDVSDGGTVVFEPALKVVIAGSPAAITLKASHVANLGFNPMAFAFVSRPLEQEEAPGAIIRSTFDPVSSLTLRLEIKREHKRTRWSWDILYGVKTIRPELAVRLAG